MKIGFGCDHAAVDLKDKMIAYMKEKGTDVEDKVPKQQLCF